MDTVIHAIYSSPYGHELSWRFNGIQLNSNHFPYSMESDGFNAFLIIKELSEEVYGTYSLSISGTSAHDEFTFLPR